ncbi:50S ribosomal protein L3 [bacterium]|nr:MAG: 50S ribosomal protein L3 [bacterium]
MIGLIGKKIGMTLLFAEDGRAIPVTIIQAGPCEITQVKTRERDGYTALQLGFEPTEKKVSKPVLGHFKKAGTKVYKKLREIRASDIENFEVGQVLTVEMFNEGDKVSLTGVSKGKGFQGGRKRYGFKGGPKSHGQSNKWRSPGSIGQSSSPSRVFKGMNMAGRMGGTKVTQSGNEIIRIDAEDNLIIVKGATPGARGSYIIVKKR